MLILDRMTELTVWVDMVEAVPLKEQFSGMDIKFYPQVSFKHQKANGGQIHGSP
jgi:hypothetical protein